MASLAMISPISALVIFNQEGEERLKGRAEPLMPLPGVCMRPMVAVRATDRTVRASARSKEGEAGGPARFFFASANLFGRKP